MKPVHPEVREAAIKVCGQAFFYREQLRVVFVNAGYPPAAFDRFVTAATPKYTICREIFRELDAQGDKGRAVQHEVVRQLEGLHAPMDGAIDPVAGQQALRHLQSLVDLPSDDEVAASAARRNRRDLRAQARAANATKMQALKETFADLSANTRRQTAQERGYEFERFLGDLFAAHDLEFRRPYRVGSVEQIDGALRFRGNDYLIEARWRQEPPAINDLMTFAGKIGTKTDWARGLFISMIPPRSEVLDQLARVSRRVLIMDGQDLALIVQGMYSLQAALETKESKAVQEGILFFSLGHVRAA